MWLHIPTLAVCFNPRTNWEVSVQQENICIITALHTAVLHSSEQRHSSYGVTGTVTVCGSCCCKCDHSYFNFIALKRQFTKSLTRFSHVGFWAARLHAASAQSAWKDPFIQHILFQLFQSPLGHILILVTCGYILSECLFITFFTNVLRKMITDMWPYPLYLVAPSEKCWWEWQNSNKSSNVVNKELVWWLFEPGVLFLFPIMHCGCYLALIQQKYI